MNAKKYLIEQGVIGDPNERVVNWLEQYADHKTQELQKENVLGKACLISKIEELQNEIERLKELAVRTKYKLDDSKEENQQLQKEVERVRKIAKRNKIWYRDTNNENQQLKQANKELVTWLREVANADLGRIEIIQDAQHFLELLTKHKTEL